MWNSRHASRSHFSPDKIKLCFEDECFWLSWHTLLVQIAQLVMAPFVTISPPNRRQHIKQGQETFSCPLRTVLGWRHSSQSANLPKRVVSKQLPVVLCRADNKLVNKPFNKPLHPRNAQSKRDNLWGFGV